MLLIGSCCPGKGFNSLHGRSTHLSPPTSCECGHLTQLQSDHQCYMTVVMVAAAMIESVISRPTSAAVIYTTTVRSSQPLLHQYILIRGITSTFIVGDWRPLPQRPLSLTMTMWEVVSTIREVRSFLTNLSHFSNCEARPSTLNLKMWELRPLQTLWFSQWSIRWWFADRF